MNSKSEIENKDAWLKAVRQSMDDYSAPLPSGGWQRLKQDLPSSTLAPATPKSSRAWVPWMRIAAAAVLLTAIVSSALFFLYTPQAEQVRRMSQVESTESTVEHPVTDPLINDDVTERALAVVKQYPERNTPSTVTSEPMKISLEEPEGPSVDLTQKKPEVDVDSSIRETAPTVHRPTKRTDPVIASPKRKKGGWSVALAAASSAGISTTQGGADFGPMADPSNTESTPALPDMGVMNDGIITVPNDMTLAFKGGIPYLYKTNYTYHHKQPISFGLSVRKDLSLGFSVEAGVNYTLLSSDVEINGNKTINQQLHYVGVPLRLNWSLVQSDRYNVYVGAGATVEKCVYGKIGSEKLTIDPLQLSMNGAIGAQYNLVKHLGVYAEVGMSHYFDDGSEVETIRKENKLNLNLQLGFRLHY